MFKRLIPSSMRRILMLSVLSIFSIIFIISIIFTSAYAGKEDEFREYLNQAKSLKDSVVRSTSGFAPETVFNNYNVHPESAKYYSEDDAGANQTIRSDSITKVGVDKEGQAIAASSKMRTQFKINPESEEIRKSREIQKTADAVKGVADELIGRRERQLDTIQTRYVIRTCNEEIRPLKRICNKTPVVTTSIKDAACPNCKSVVVTQGAWTYCPAGYTEIVYSDMIRPDTYDDVRVCVKEANVGENVECFGGYLVHGLALPGRGDRDVKSTERAIVPKNMHGRIRFSNFFSSYMIMTIINETTGVTLYSRSQFANGQVIELPFSEIQDQVFRFYDHGEPDGRGRFHRDWGYCCGKGVMILYVDHINKERVAEVAWQEICRNV